MTRAKASAWPGQNAVAFKPAARLGHDVGSGYLDTPVHEQQRLAGQLGRDRVHRTGQPAAVARHRTAGDHRHHVLRRLQAGDDFRFSLSDLTPAGFGGTQGQGMRKILRQFLVSRDVSGAAAELEQAAGKAYPP